MWDARYFPALIGKELCTAITIWAVQRKHYVKGRKFAKHARNHKTLA